MPRLKAVEAVCEPDVPVTVTAYWPAGVVPETFKVKAMLLLLPVTGLGEKLAVTPLGSPDTVSLTLPVNPYSGYMDRYVVACVPWPMLTAFIAENVKVGA